MRILHGDPDDDPTLLRGCGKPFEPRPQVPDQTYCSAPDCQRARKRAVAAGQAAYRSDYRDNQRAPSVRGSTGIPATGAPIVPPEIADSGGTTRQRHAVNGDRGNGLAKMDVSILPRACTSFSRRSRSPRQQTDGSWLVEITPVAPMTAKRTCAKR
jgi:hypothetical protein